MSKVKTFEKDFLKKVKFLKVKRQVQSSSVS